MGGGDKIFRPMIQNENLYKMCNNSGIRLIHFATSKKYNCEINNIHINMTTWGAFPDQECYSVR